MSQPPDRVIVEILVAAPIETVWKALKEPSEVARWFGWDYPNLVPDIEMMWANNKADESGRVLYSEGMPDRFTVEDLGSHTIVRVIRSAPVADDAAWKGIYDDTFEGWLTFFYQLKFALERHRGENRRTLFLNGRAKAPGTPHPVDALGVARLWVVPTGERYNLDVVTGDRLEGTILYRSANQVGLTVDGFGDGLIIASIRPKTAKSPHGGGSVLITTYGLTDTALQEMRERWSRWWTATYEVIEIHP